MPWHIHHGGIVKQLSGDAIQKGLASGTIPADALVWSEGMPEWRPAAAVFAASSAAPLGSAANAPAVGGASRLALLLAVLASTGVSVYVALDPHEHFALMQRSLGPAPAVLIQATTLATVAALGFAVTVWTWKHPSRRRASRFAGALFLSASSVLLFQLVNLIAFLVAVPDIYRLANAQLAAPNATVIKTGAASASIVGPIGPNLMRDFMELERQGGSIEAIEITSEGGLVDQALQLARYVEARRTKVVVRGQCSSACILIGIASPESYADADAVYGFHRPSALADLSSEIAIYFTEQSKETFHAFLKQHGVPESVLVEAAKHGRESLYEVSARDMAKFGAIKGVVADGELVTIDGRR